MAVSNICLVIMSQLLALQAILSRRISKAKTVRNIAISKLGALPTATGQMTRYAYALARKAKIELRPILDEVGLTYEQIEDRDRRIPVPAQIKFVNEVADALQDPLLGFHIAQSAELRELGLLYYVAASAETLDEALQRVARYAATANEGLSLEYHARPDIRVELGYVGVARHLDRQQMECCMTVLLRVCRQLTGRRLIPTRVRLLHPGNSRCGEFSAYFGGHVDFSAGIDELTFPGQTREMAVVSADPYLNRLLVASCEEALARRRTSRDSFRSIVENAIVPLLPHGKAHAGEIAARLGLSPRTSARRLAAEGLTFSQVLDAMRVDLARQYVAQRNLSISRIAWLLGYHEPSGFSHAYKRWTGKTPRQARADEELSMRAPGHQAASVRR